MPPVWHSSNASVAEPRTVSRSQRSVRVGTTEASSRRARAAGEKRAIRAKTASRTIRGTPGVSLARTSVTKKGSPLSRYRAAQQGDPPAVPGRSLLVQKAGQASSGPPLSPANHRALTARDGQGSVRYRG